jgi:hypothetical protein
MGTNLVRVEVESEKKMNRELIEMVEKEHRGRNKEVEKDCEKRDETNHL